jgi:hypothetical protein
MVKKKIIQILDKLEILDEIEIKFRRNLDEIKMKFRKPYNKNAQLEHNLDEI